ncbi:HAD hydrolase-like protein [Phenylobacterium sp.]|uniref:HAD hydrolase-like protein n=1 Tax=Phenylobacterium sp. TaxID=1871053 RepID=UPI0035B21E56
MPADTAPPDLSWARLIIFDFDGTLADSAAFMFGLFGELARKHGLRQVSDAEIAMLRGRSNREVLAYLRCPLWKLPGIARDARRMGAAGADRIRLFDGVPELFSALAARGAKVAIVSSNAEATIRRILGPVLAGQVAAYACGASLFGKAAKFREVVERCGVAPAETLCVGDEVRDIDAARDAGLACAAVTWGYATAEVLEAHRPDVTFDAVSALTAALSASAFPGSHRDGREP